MPRNPRKRRRRSRSRSRSKPRAVKTEPEDRDPISLEPVGMHAFKVVRNGVSIKYNLSTLLDYILTTGDWRDPVCRVPWSEAELALMDAMAAAGGFMKPSVVKAKKSGSSRFEAAREAENALLGLERCVSGAVAQAVQALEDFHEARASCHDDDGDLEFECQTQLALLMPSIAHDVQQLASTSRTSALDTLEVAGTFALGPPRRRTPNPAGYRDCLLRYLTALKRQVHSGRTVDGNAASTEAFSPE